MLGKAFRSSDQVTMKMHSAFTSAGSAGGKRYDGDIFSGSITICEFRLFSLDELFEASNAFISKSDNAARRSALKCFFAIVKNAVVTKSQVDPIFLRDVNQFPR